MNRKTKLMMTLVKESLKTSSFMISILLQVKVSSRLNSSLSLVFISPSTMTNPPTPWYGCTMRQSSVTNTSGCRSLKQKGSRVERSLNSFSNMKKSTTMSRALVDLRATKTSKKIRKSKVLLVLPRGIRMANIENSMSLRWRDGRYIEGYRLKVWRIFGQ